MQPWRLTLIRYWNIRSLSSAIIMLTGVVLAASIPLAADVNYTITTVAGSSSAGDTGPATSALLLQAEQLAFDVQGNLFIADAADHRIRRVSTAGIITTVAGTGAKGFSGDGAQATAAQLDSPYGIAFDSLGVLYIADLGNRRVRRVRADGIIETVAGGGTSAPTDGATATQVRLDSPRNVAVDSTGTIYISDFGANRLYRVNSSGKIGVHAGGGAAGAPSDGVLATSIELLSPAGLAVGAGNRVYVAASGSKRVFRIDSGVAYQLNAIGLTAPTGVAVDGAGTVYIADRLHGATIMVLANGASTEIALAGRSVALNGNGVYLSDSQVVRRITTTGVISIVAGTTGTFTGDGGAVQLSRLSLPSGACADSIGALYIADTGNHRIRKVALNGTITTLAGTGEAGYSGDGGPAASAKLSSPGGVAIDRQGNLYIADTGNHVIRRVTPEGSIATLAGTGAAGYGGDNVLASRSAFSSPGGVTVDSNGNLYIADTANHRVRKMFVNGVTVTLAGTGVAGFSGDDGLATAAQLNAPLSTALDDTGNLYIADTGNNVVRRIAADGKITTLVRTQSAAWNSPQGVAVSRGDVIVSDTGNHRLLRVTAAGYVQVIAGTTVSGFSGDGGQAATAAVSSPRGLFADSLGSVYFADSANHRIRKLTIDTSTTDPLAPGGQAVVDAKLLSVGSYLEGAVAPGQLVSIIGSGLGPELGSGASMTAGSSVATTLGGVQVTFDGTPAPLLYVQDNQINLQVPYNVAGKTLSVVVISYHDVTIWSQAVSIVEASPALLTVGAGTGPALAVNSDGVLNSVAPAARGSIVTLYATGEGVTNPASLEGKPATLPLPSPALAVRVLVGDNPAEVLYASPAPAIYRHPAGERPTAGFAHAGRGRFR